LRHIGARAWHTALRVGDVISPKARSKSRAALKPRLGICKVVAAAGLRWALSSQNPRQPAKPGCFAGEAPVTDFSGIAVCGFCEVLKKFFE
jgi:hypothetical protein